MITYFVLVLAFANFNIGSSEINCGHGEVLSDCANAGCGHRNCTEKGRSILCRDIFAGGCVPGCICKSDYLRAANGTCVPIDECPAIEVCSQEHEYYDECPPECLTRDCRYVDSEPCQPGSNEEHITCGPPSCRCEEGFYRDFNGHCVTLEQCFAAFDTVN